MLCFIIIFILIHFYTKILTFFLSFWGSSGITAVAVADILDKWKPRNRRKLYDTGRWKPSWEVLQLKFATNDPEGTTGLKDQPFGIRKNIFKFLQKNSLGRFAFEVMVWVNFSFRHRLRRGDTFNPLIVLQMGKFVILLSLHAFSLHINVDYTNMRFKNLRGIKKEN